MSLGGLGVVSVFANICPKQSHELTYAILNGDYNKARKIQVEYADLTNVLFSDVNPIPVKAALRMIGFDCGKCRLPLIDMEISTRDNLEKIMKKHKLL